MIAHPNRSRSRLAQYGARLRTIEGRKTVETVDPNDGARRRFHYRRSPGGGLERRILRSDGSPFIDTGSPWEPYTAREIAAMAAQRGEYHPILDPLGLDNAAILALLTGEQ